MISSYPSLWEVRRADAVHQVGTAVSNLLQRNPGGSNGLEFRGWKLSVIRELLQRCAQQQSNSPA